MCKCCMLLIAVCVKHCPFNVCVKENTLLKIVVLYDLWKKMFIEIYDV